MTPTDIDNLKYFHLCDRDGFKEPVLMEYGSLVCSMCRKWENSVSFMTTDDQFQKLKNNFSIQRNKTNNND